jgi:hypothetical protein
MGTTLRIFLVNEDDSVRSLSRACYERLLRRESEEALPEYATKRVRCAVVVLDMLQRKPLAISRVVYSFLSFDSDGRLDAAERERETRMALEVVPSTHTRGEPQRVIDARHHFAKRRFDREFRWTPTPEIEAAILDHIFGRDMTPL